MSFVDNYILPWKFLKRIHAYSYSLKSCDANIEFSRGDHIFDNVLSALLFGDEIDHRDLGTPFLEFCHPVSNDWLWHDDQMKAFVLFKFSQET